MTTFHNKYVILLPSKFLTFHTLVHESIRNNPHCQTLKLMVKANEQKHGPSFEKLKAQTIQATIYLERSYLRFQNSSPKLLPSIDFPAFQQKNSSNRKIDSPAIPRISAHNSSLSLLLKANHTQRGSLPFFQLKTQEEAANNNPLLLLLTSTNHRFISNLL